MNLNFEAYNSFQIVSWIYKISYFVFFILFCG